MSLEPVPARGPERVAWWARLYDVLADDADAQRAQLASLTPDDHPSHAEKWFEGYREHLHDLVDHAVDRRVWQP